MTRHDWTEPADVLDVLQRRWRAGIDLAGVAAGKDFAPIEVPLRGPTAGELASRFGEAQEWVQRWRRAAGSTMRIEDGAIGGRTVGTNRLPRRVWLDTPAQLWRVLRVDSVVAVYLDRVDRTRAAAPELIDWMLARPLKVIELGSDWDLLVRTVRWIADQPVLPTLYLRQVDVPGVDTKFIERHRGVIAALLDLLLPVDRIDSGFTQSDFLQRYGFRRKPEYVRFRMLDRSDELAAGSGFTEMTVRADELSAQPLPVRRIYAVENEISYLAFPRVPESAVIFGGGYAVSALRHLGWLADRELVYWGDLDTHGFAMLSLVRLRFPHTVSMLMDRRTLLDHEGQWVQEKSPTKARLDYLTRPEQDLYTDLVENNLGPAVRLEQERIRFSALENALGRQLER